MANLCPTVDGGRPMRSSGQSPREFDRRVWLAILLIILLGLVACSDKDKKAQKSEPLTMKVEFAGCSNVRQGPICELTSEPKKRRLRIWVKTEPKAALQLLADGKELTHEVHDEQSGRRIKVVVPEGVEGIEIRATLGDRIGGWFLKTVPFAKCSELEDAVALINTGKSAQALGKLNLPETEVEPRCRGRFYGLKARALLNLDRSAEAISSLRKSIELHRQSNNTSQWVLDAAVLVYIYNVITYDIGNSRAVLDSLQPAIDINPEGLPHLAYNRGLLADTTGDLREALRLYIEADRAARRLEMNYVGLLAREQIAIVLYALGRNEEGHRGYESLLATISDDLNNCHRARILSNFAWYGITDDGIDWAVASNGARLKRYDPLPVMKQALEIYRNDCPSRAEEANLLIDFAVYHLKRGQLDDAEQALVQARSRNPQPDALNDTWLLDLDGQLALARGNAKAALKAYDRLGELALPMSEGRLRATLGRANALRALNKIDEAIATYETAELLLEEQMLLVPLSEGRASFLANRDLSATALIDLLVKKGETERAFLVSRAARSRVLRGLQRFEQLSQLSPQAQQIWDRSIANFFKAQHQITTIRAQYAQAARNEQAALDQSFRLQEQLARRALDQAYAAISSPRSQTDYRRPKTGELFLLYHPTKDGTWGFADDGKRVLARRLEAVVPEADPRLLSDTLLTPFADHIETASRLHLMVPGKLWQVDFHALPWKKGVLIEQLTVVYALDSGSAESTPDKQKQMKKALIALDPRGDLSQAYGSGDNLVRRITTNGYAAVRLLRQNEITRSALVRALVDSNLFHYGGHAEHHGREGWESRLLLCNDQSLSIADILALPRVPEQVVLAACESGQAASTTKAQTLGLGQAFVTAGAGQVIAASRPISDILATQLSGMLYNKPFIDAAAALRSAQRSLLTEKNNPDWAAFRALGP